MAGLLWILGLSLQPIAAWRVVEGDLNGCVALCIVALTLLGASRAVSWLRDRQATVAETA